MNLFGRRTQEAPGTAARLDALEAELAKIASTVRTVETEQITMHDHVRRWMRRAVAAQRVVEAEREPIPSPAVSGVEGNGAARVPRRRLGVWGARRRIAEREARALASGSSPAPAAETEADNGLHS